jgi:hypothetical protein
MKRFASLLLAFGLATGLAGGPLVQSTQASSLEVCGRVDAYVHATALATGLLTVNGATFVVATGVVLPASVTVGADACLALTTNSLGLVTGAAVTANVHATVRLCGRIDAFVAATATATGLLTIGPRTLTIGIGTKLPAAVNVGSDLCLDLQLDGFGRVSGCDVSADVSSHVRICGDVSAYAAATNTTLGSLDLGGRSFKIAYGAVLPAAVKAGADLCADLTLNGFAQVSNGSVKANVLATVDVCGQVGAYAAATSTNDGHLVIGAVDRGIAAGTSLDARVKANAYLKLHLVVDAFGRVTDATVVKVGISITDACGISVPAPSPTPAPSDAPGAGSTPAPSAAPTSGPGASSGPSASAEPGATPEVSAGPGGGGSGAESPGDNNQCGTASTVGTDHSGTLLPSTDAIGRASEVVTSNALPLVMIGFLGGLVGWYRSRRAMGGAE